MVIIRTIEVNDNVPVIFDLPVNQRTNVTLTENVPIAANATFTLPGGGGLINGRVDIVLPQNLVLPVELSMNVPVNTQIPIELPVDVEILLRRRSSRSICEPAQPAGAVRPHPRQPARQLEPGARLSIDDPGRGINLLTPTVESANPWPFTTGVRPEDGADFQPTN